MKLLFKIKHLGFAGNFFKGEVEHRGQEYTINLQHERRGQILKLPVELPTKKKRVTVRFSGTHVFVEDYLPYRGESEWVEIDSTKITYYTADHQRYQFDTLEITDEPTDDL